jgi:hypothetical protein
MKSPTSFTIWLTVVLGSVFCMDPLASLPLAPQSGGVLNDTLREESLNSIPCMSRTATEGAPSGSGCGPEGRLWLEERSRGLSALQARYVTLNSRFVCSDVSLGCQDTFDAETLDITEMLDFPDSANIDGQGIDRFYSGDAKSTRNGTSVSGVAGSGYCMITDKTSMTVVASFSGEIFFWIIS